VIANRPLRKALAADATSTSFPAKVSSVTEPAGDGVINVAGYPGGLVPTQLMLHPYGTGDNDATFDLRVTGWRRAISTSSSTRLWVPIALGQFTCTLSQAVGVSGAVVSDTERFADTIIVHATISGAQGRTTDTDSGGAASTGTTVIHSPGNDLIATIYLPILAVEKVELTFDSTHASTTAMNCLYCLL
jgi:hypothetical protein